MTPDDVLKLKGPTQKFLCALNANIYNVEFRSFVIRDMDTGEVIFSVSRSLDEHEVFQESLEQISDEESELARCVCYRFSRSFLDLKVVGGKLVFVVNGDVAVPNLRLIERHYFRDILIKSFDFNFGFCIPHSENTWEVIYDMPKFSNELKKDIIDNSDDVVCDSFYFVGDTMIMHNKARYIFE